MSIQLMIVVLYVAMLFAISFYVKRRAETSATEYQFAGRKFGALLIAVSVTGMAVGAASTVGVAESATRIGLSAGWYNGAWSIGAIFMGLVAAGILHHFAAVCGGRFHPFHPDARRVHHEDGHDHQRRCVYRHHGYRRHVVLGPVQRIERADHLPGHHLLYGEDPDP